MPRKFSFLHQSNLSFEPKIGPLFLIFLFPLSTHPFFLFFLSLILISILLCLLFLCTFYFYIFISLTLFLFFSFSYFLLSPCSSWFAFFFFCLSVHNIAQNYVWRWLRTSGTFWQIILVILKCFGFKKSSVICYQIKSTYSFKYLLFVDCFFSKFNFTVI